MLVDLGMSSGMAATINSNIRLKNLIINLCFTTVNDNSNHITNQTNKFVANRMISMTFKKRDLAL